MLIYKIIPETLFDFRVNINQSTIPNAGYGAFLTYLGARVLKRQPLERSARLMKEHIVENDIDTHNSLDAETIGGRRMNVSLTGDNLHHNDNSIYWTKKRSCEFSNYLKSLPPGDGGSREFDESEVDCVIHQEVEKLRKSIPQGEGIGFLGINQESDYRWDCNRWLFDLAFAQLSLLNLFFSRNHYNL